MMGKNHRLTPEDIRLCTIVQQYGSERTGTTYTQRLLFMNFSNLIMISGNKHAGPSRSDGESYMNLFLRKRIRISLGERDGWKIFELSNILRELNRKRRDGEIKYVISVRNPYAAVLSWIKRGEPIHKSVLNWNKNNRRYIEFSMRQRTSVIILDLEQLIGNTKVTLQIVKEQLDFTYSPAFFTNIKTHSHAEPLLETGKIFEKVLLDPFDRTYQLQHRYLDELGMKNIQLINRYVDQELCEWLGYQLVHDRTNVI